jgi:hypothetical protein
MATSQGASQEKGLGGLLGPELEHSGACPCPQPSPCSLGRLATIHTAALTHSTVLQCAWSLVLKGLDNHLASSELPFEWTMSRCPGPAGLKTCEWLEEEVAGRAQVS